MMELGEDSPDERPEISTRPQEQLLIESLSAFAPRRFLCISQGRGQLALAAARQFPAAAVHCHWFDLYPAELARQYACPQPPNLVIGCAADFPADEIDLAALPLSAQGEGELARDLLQSAHERLAPGGSLVASTDNPSDRWLHERMRAMFATVTRRQSADGAVYVARKEGPLKRRRSFTAEFAFRDAGRLIQVVSRPAVFSHREVDPGARQLLAAMEIREGWRVLDIGCGSGVVALAAACRAKGVAVLAIDSHARAVECTARGAQRNGLTNVVVEHTATGPAAGQGIFDLVLGNPPYYAGFRIARFFLETGRAALRPGGEIVIVTKRPDWYIRNMPQRFDDVHLEPSKDYWIARGRRP